MMEALRALIGAALAALCFSAQAQTPDSKLAEIVAGGAKYQAVSDCMTQGKDATAQVACVLGIAMMERQPGNSQPIMVAPQPQQPAQVQLVEKPCDGFFGCLFSGIGKGIQRVADFADRNAIGLGQIYSGQRIAMRQAASADRASDNQLQRDVALYGTWRDTNAASVNAVRDTAAAGYNTIALLPTQQTTTYTLNNAQGIQFGGGTLSYTGPVTRNCNGGTAAAGGSATGTTGTTNGGAGAPANGGSC